jgi:hypothetical protein
VAGLAPKAKEYTEEKRLLSTPDAEEGVNNESGTTLAASSLWTAVVANPTEKKERSGYQCLETYFNGTKFGKPSTTITGKPNSRPYPI